MHDLTEPTSLSLVEAAAAVANGEMSAVELLEASLARVAATEDTVGAFSSTQADMARADAERLDKIAPSGPLHGVPVALKDLFFTAGVATEANCEALRGFVPDRDATVVTRLRAAGAVVMGKTNTEELAYGVSCPTSHNPWNPTRMTGGSSGGNSAALAARQVFGALGTDTGGSVRIPSSYCGTTAIKTTRGTVPRDGVHLISWTYDTVGPMARTAADCAALLDVINGPSPEDPYSSRTPLAAPSDPGSLRLGVPDDRFFDGIDMDAEVRAVMDEASRVLASVVGSLATAHLPPPDEHFGAGATIVFAESAALLEDLRSRAGHLIGEAPQAFMNDGAATTATALAHAQAARTACERAWLDVFDRQGFDLIITPVTPNHVLPHGATELQGVPLIPATTQFTFPVNGAGLPAIALPGGFASDGMPIGFQLIGKPFADRTLAATGKAFQALTDYHNKTPIL